LVWPDILSLQYCRHSFLTCRSCPLTKGDLATWTKWVVTAFGETIGRL